MKYAVVKTGGKQYKVSEGDVIEVERLPHAQNAQLTFDTVLLFVEDGNVMVGTPGVSGAMVKGEVISHTKGEKIRVSKFKAKARYRRVTGHRQSLTQVKISQIMSSNTKKDTKEKAAESPKPTKKVKTVVKK